MVFPSNNVQGSEKRDQHKGWSGHATSPMFHGCNHVCCMLKVALLACCSAHACKVHVEISTLYVAGCKL